MTPQDPRSGPPPKADAPAGLEDSQWGAFDAAEPAQDAQAARQTLKKMLERKRHNDAVRKLEFDELRRLRQAEAASRGPQAEKTAPSLYASDMSDLSDLSERASTLKKINDIESEMSEQWWHGRRATSGAPITTMRPADLGGSGRDATSRPAPAQATDALPLDEVMTTQQDHGGLDDTQPMGLFMPVGAQQASALNVGASSVFAASRQSAPSRSRRPADAVLEEAAIRFASQDDAGAAAVLRQALQNDKTPPDVAAPWLHALLDLYRRTGQREAFDSLAAQMSARCGGAAPRWDQNEQAGADGFADTVILPPASGAEAQQLTLSGELRGDCQDWLDSLELPRQTSLTVWCRDLSRVDAAAAGCLLNWAARLESAGGRIVLRDVAPLVAAFFHLIGISEHAQVQARED